MCLNNILNVILKLLTWLFLIFFQEFTVVLFNVAIKIFFNFKINFDFNWIEYLNDTETVCEKNGLPVYI